MNGFPDWTLWGMVLSGLGALIALALAYLAQSPRFLSQTGRSGQGLNARVRTLTGYALALLLMAFGFFFAGVPLGSPEITAVSTPAPPPTITPETAGEIVSLTDADLTATAVAIASPTATNTRFPASTPATGAFGGPPGGTPEESVTPELETPSPTPTSPVELTPAGGPPATPTHTPTSTATPTPTPTETPTPTLTPTPIEGETAVIILESGTLAVQRVPGGEPLARVRGGDIVILLPGHANYGGDLWREISTVEGIAGWVPEAFLDYQP